MIPLQRSATARSVVVDASAMVDVLTGQPNREGLVGLLLGDGTALHVPAFFDLEVVSVARRLELAGRLTARRADELLADFADLGISRHSLPPLTARVWSLRDWVRVADAYYVSLAEALEVPLLTTDLLLARAVRDREVVEVLDLDER
ncbi:MAG: PIN domain-containing protein [Pseudonocardiaceae bacterium]|nr:PIN domain-containing protein [Pseudonocardiaceae bacterium]